MSVQITIIGATDRRLEELVQSCGLRPTAASAVDLLALAHPGAAQPDVLVVDVRPHGQVPAALAALKRQHPTTSVMLVASDLAPALMLEAMRAGVNECVAEPLTADRIGGALTRMLADRKGPIGGQMFAFVGAKGGVGTTTLAVNVATALGREASNTLFIDMHPAYGDAAVLFGVEPRFSVIDALENTHRLDPAFFSGLTAQTAAGPTLLGSSDHPPTSQVDAHRVRLLLDFAVRHFRYTVLDLPRSNLALLDTLENAANIVVVTNQELASVRGASRVATALSRRYGREKVSVVVSRFDKAAEIGPEDIEDAVRVPVRFTFPSDYRVALHALNGGRPLVLDGSGKLAASITAFSGHLKGEAPAAPAAAPAHGGLRARLGAQLRWLASA